MIMTVEKTSSDRRFRERRKINRPAIHELLFGLFIGLVVLTIGLAMYFAMVTHLDQIYEKNRICLINNIRLTEQNEEILRLKDVLCFDHGVCK